MTDENDWRLTDPKTYLEGATLCWKKYARYSESWDHDHCSFCWAKFMVEDHPDVLHEGYATEDEYHWIRKECFEGFKDRFGWKVEQ